MLHFIKWNSFHFERVDAKSVRHLEKFKKRPAAFKKCFNLTIQAPKLWQKWDHSSVVLPQPLTLKTDREMGLY